MTTYVQVKCPYCSKHQCVDKEFRYDPYECNHCCKTVEPSCGVGVASTPGIISDRTRVGGKLSSEFRTGVLDKIMSVKGANNGGRKYG